MAAEQPPRRGGSRRVTLSEGQRLRITGMSLADPAAAAGGGGQALVTVLADVGHEVRTVGTLSPEHPIAPVLPPVELDDGEIFLRHDSAASSVRLYGYYLDPPEQDGEGEPTRRRFFVDVDAEELGGEEEEAGVEHEDETLAVEDLEVRYDSDCGEDESDDGDGDVDGEEGDETSESSDVEADGETSKRRKTSPEDCL